MQKKKFKFIVTVFDQIEELEAKKAKLFEQFTVVSNEIGQELDKLENLSDEQDAALMSKDLAKKEQEQKQLLEEIEQIDVQIKKLTPPISLKTRCNKILNVIYLILGGILVIATNYLLLNS